MARTFIGIDIDNNILRAIAIEEDGKEQKTVALAQRELASSEDLAAEAENILGEWDSSHTRLAITLPAAQVLGRQLQFPFGDRRKISAALPLELGARLPVNITDHVITSLPPKAFESSFRTIGLAVPQPLISATLEPFDTRQLPLVT